MIESQISTLVFAAATLDIVLLSEFLLTPMPLAGTGLFALIVVWSLRRYLPRIFVWGMSVFAILNETLDPKMYGLLTAFFSWVLNFGLERHLPYEVASAKAWEMVLLVIGTVILGIFVSGLIGAVVLKRKLKHRLPMMAH